jgi:hypothetical protein
MLKFHVDDASVFGSHVRTKGKARFWQLLPLRKGLRMEEATRWWPTIFRIA